MRPLPNPQDITALSRLGADSKLVVFVSAIAYRSHWPVGNHNAPMQYHNTGLDRSF
jgi:hypothetical protein